MFLSQVYQSFFLRPDINKPFEAAVQEWLTAAAQLFIQPRVGTSPCTPRNSVSLLNWSKPAVQTDAVHGFNLNSYHVSKTPSAIYGFGPLIFTHSREAVVLSIDTQACRKRSLFPPITSNSQMAQQWIASYGPDGQNGCSFTPSNLSKCLDSISPTRRSIPGWDTKWQFYSRTFILVSRFC